MTLIFGLQVFVSVVFFANKVLVLAGKKSGWLVGMIAASVAMIYFYLIQLYVFTTLEVGLVILMGYGFFAGKEKKLGVERLLHLTIAIVMLILTWFVFSGMLTALEFLSSVGMLWGTYLLTHRYPILGWGTYGLAHFIATVIGYQTEQWFFADFQLASAVVSVVGVMISARPR